MAGSGALFAEMGTGKSRVVVGIVAAHPRSIRRAVVVTLKSAMGVWPREFRTHAIGEVEVVLLNERMSVKRRAQEIREYRPNKPVVFVLNYESFQWTDPRTQENPVFVAIRDSEIDFLILDESQKIKAPGGVTSKRLAALAPHIPYRMILTGTPLDHSPLDAYAQYRFLDVGVFGTSFARFRDRYAVVRYLPGNIPVVEGYQREQELAERMYTIAFRVGKEVLDLPPTMDVERTFQLGAEARRAYRGLNNGMVAQVVDGTASVNNTLTLLLRLQQITGGHLQLNDEINDEAELERGELVEVDHGKRELLREVLVETGATAERLEDREPVVVVARYRADLDNIRKVVEELGLTYGEISGRQKDLTPDAKMPDWVDVMGVQARAGSSGIDLTRARYAVFYSMDHGVGQNDQIRSRIHRPGQTRPTTYIYLLAEDTVDGHILGAVRAGKNVVDYITDVIRQEEEL